jgi:hypothetical protein
MAGAVMAIGGVVPPQAYTENESKALVFTKIANTAIERVFILIMMTPILIVF